MIIHNYCFKALWGHGVYFVSMQPDPSQWPPLVPITQKDPDHAFKVLLTLLYVFFCVCVLSLSLSLSLSLPLPLKLRKMH